MSHITNQHDLDVGDKFIFTKTDLEWEDVSVNKVYVVEGKDEDGDLFFQDDVGEKNYALVNIGGGWSGGVFEKVECGVGKGGNTVGQ